MDLSKIRAEARNVLNGKWGKAVCIVLAYILLEVVLGGIEGYFPESSQNLIGLLLEIISVPLSFGIIISFVKLYDGEIVGAFDFINFGFNNFIKSWGINLNIIIKLIVPSFILVVSIVVMGVCYFSGNMSLVYIVGIILIVSFIYLVMKSYYYQLVYFIAADKPELTSKEVVEISEQIMQNKRWNLFCLQFSFIGWAILCIFTLGIGYLWLVPYIQMSLISFYKDIISENSSSSSYKLKNVKS